MRSSAVSLYSSRKECQNEKQCGAPICTPDFRRQASERKNPSMIAHVLIRSGRFAAETRSLQGCIQVSITACAKRERIGGLRCTYCRKVLTWHGVAIYKALLVQIPTGFKYKTAIHF